MPRIPLDETTRVAVSAVQATLWGWVTGVWGRGVERAVQRGWCGFLDCFA